MTENNGIKHAATVLVCAACTICRGKIIKVAAKKVK